MIVCLAAGSLYQPSSSAMASPGEEAFHDNDFLAAAQYYEEALAKDPDNAALHYNHGTAAYKNNLYDDAIASFDKALQSDDLLLQEKAYYNRANAQFKKGEESLQADPGKTIAGWKEALTSYQAALQLRPDNEEAAANLDLVLKKLEELEQQEHNRKNEEQKGEEGDSDETKQDGDEKQADSKPLEDREQQRDNSGMKNDEKQPDRNTPDKQEANPPKDGLEEEKQHPEEAEPQPDAGPDNQKHLQAKEGQMSKEEAEQLLKEMKNEEGALNFIPKTDTAPQEDTQGSNW
jgi:Ca-activated chloride channel family protein